MIAPSLSNSQLSVVSLDASSTHNSQVPSILTLCDIYLQINEFAENSLSASAQKSPFCVCGEYQPTILSLLSLLCRSLNLLASASKFKSDWWYIITEQGNKATKGKDYFTYI
ncbi:UNKNOWN [Stylonychia lemnae]|uniref:Uncharacterized protein n=1 Tax=Stylonychia lemnae TaxID=5949 RepID=A0A077ZZK4_STYLE|nr:UNKNOWN [Stylonychia lemnae]|eukprot:CDW74668.1 UNKNOWN [Stylonychia lemnae]